MVMLLYVIMCFAKCVSLSYPDGYPDGRVWWGYGLLKIQPIGKLRVYTTGAFNALRSCAPRGLTERFKMVHVTWY